MRAAWRGVSGARGSPPAAACACAPPQGQADLRNRSGAHRLVRAGGSRSWSAVWSGYWAAPLAACAAARTRRPCRWLPPSRRRIPASRTLSPGLSQVVGALPRRWEGGCLWPCGKEAWWTAAPIRCCAGSYDVRQLVATPSLTSGGSARNSASGITCRGHRAPPAGRVWLRVTDASCTGGFCEPPPSLG